MTEQILNPDFVVLPSGDMMPVHPGWEQEDEDFIGALIAGGVTLASSLIGKKSNDDSNDAAERMQQAELKEQRRQKREAEKLKREQEARQKEAAKFNFLADRNKKEMLVYGSIGLGVLVLGMVLYFTVLRN